jgi:hypothetical protein
MGETLAYNASQREHVYLAGVLRSFIAELQNPNQRDVIRNFGRSATFEGRELFRNFEEEKPTAEQVRKGYSAEFLKRDVSDKHRLIMKLVTMPDKSVVFVDDKAWIWYHNQVVKRLDKGFFDAARMLV